MIRARSKSDICTLVPGNSMSRSAFGMSLKSLMYTSWGVEHLGVAPRGPQPKDHGQALVDRHFHWFDLESGAGATAIARAHAVAATVQVEPVEDLEIHGQVQPPMAALANRGVDFGFGQAVEIAALEQPLEAVEQLAAPRVQVRHGFGGRLLGIGVWIEGGVFILELFEHPVQPGVDHGRQQSMEALPGTQTRGQRRPIRQVLRQLGVPERNELFRQRS